MSRYTLLTSILNRFAGVALSCGLVLFACWLMAVAEGARAQAAASRLLGLPLMKLVYAGLIMGFCYHLVAGIRHLVWDTGRGLERAQSQRSARLVIAVSIALMLVIGYLAWLSGTRAP